ncbi:MAG: 3-hydroxyacyl-CoA dehydrogenase family protein [Bacteroidales bacterium]|nr:3-hydroxyacyl-CoA dehydrogenase family protein [Bacteroidales bacterium]
MAELVVESIENFGLVHKAPSRTLFSKVGIVGCGTVGQSIALLISQRELEVVFIELSEERVQSAFARMDEELESMIERWGMTPGEKRAILSRISGFVGYEHLRNCDLVIEAIRSKNRDQRVTCRKEVFKNIEKYVSPETIIATNSTTIAITELSSELEFKERCVSLHFLTSTPGARLIEVVRSLYTSEETFEKVSKFITMIGKTMVQVQESPGLISIRLFVTMVNEACEILMEGVANKVDIDTTARIGLGMSLGPFELADKVGLDKVERWMDNLYSEFGDIKFKASPIIKRHVRAHQYGRSSGVGFYTYDESGKKIG